MRTIGLLGGMSWHSTVTYYTAINQGIVDALGTDRGAKILLHSVDQGELHHCRHHGGWPALGQRLGLAARGLQNAGAECLLIGSNTIHHLLPAIEAQITIPVLHIVDCVAAEAKAHGATTVGLMGTQFTLTRSDYAKRLRAHGLTVVTNDASTVADIDSILLDQGVQGIQDAASTQRVHQAIAQLAERGADVALFSCTEMGLVAPTTGHVIPAIDSAHAHARAAVSWALSNEL